MMTPIAALLGICLVLVWIYSGLTSGPMRQLLTVAYDSNPQMLSVGLRVDLLNGYIKDFYRRSRIRAGTENYKLNISRRSNVLVESMDHFKSLTPIEFGAADLTVDFKEERGLDAGGLKREWYTIVTRELFSPETSLFMETFPGANTYSFRPRHTVTGTDLDLARFAGQFIAKAIIDQQAIPAYLTRSLYRHLLAGDVDMPLEFTDYENESPVHYRTLQYLKSDDVDPTILMDLSFEIDMSDTDHHLVDLCPNGHNRQVDLINRFEYVDLVIDYKMKTSIYKQLEAFISGFDSVLPHSHLRDAFTPAELEMMIVGVTDIDIADWKRHTKYRSGFTERTVQIAWFWNVIEKKFTRAEQARVLQFVTGSSQVPLNGFGYLRQGANGGKGAFTIKKNTFTEAVDPLPSADTCFNVLFLPAYSSQDELENKLRIAINFGNEGFAFD